MAGTGLLALLDDVTTVLDDVATMTKLATKNTASVLGDDLALNAQQVAGVRAERELPVVWAVAKGSLKNKFILVPAALIISAFIPWAITPLLMIGGAFLCYEGFEKLAHRFLHPADEKEARRARIAEVLSDPTVDLVAFEREKIAGAIRTDFILSAEIIVITLGAVAGAAVAMQLAVLAAVAVLITAGVYGLVAVIVKLDDGGLYLCRKSGAGALVALQHRLGRLILASAPYLMKFLSIAGTAAMFIVGGEILAHGIPGIEEFIGTTAANAAAGVSLGGAAELIVSILLSAVGGIVAGALVLGGVKLISKAMAAIRA